MFYIRVYTTEHRTFHNIDDSTKRKNKNYFSPQGAPLKSLNHHDMSSPSTNSGKADTRVTEIMPCHKPDCSVTFHDIDVRAFHFIRTHHADGDVLPQPTVNEALDASLQKFLDAKRSLFKEPPRFPEREEDIILQCPEHSCNKTFENKATRDFHYNRMHHSRHPSVLSQLTDNSDVEHEHRRRGYWCIKADCAARFLSEELRDFHCSRAHPMLWKATQDIAIVTGRYMTAGGDIDKVVDGEKFKQAQAEMAPKPTSMNTTPKSEISEIEAMARVSEPESDITETTSLSGSRLNKRCILGAFETPGVERIWVEYSNGIVVDHIEDIAVMKVDMEAPANPSSEPITDVEEAEPGRRPYFQHRSRSQMMMDRNALANPGASKWVVRD